MPEPLARLNRDLKTPDELLPVLDGDLHRNVALAGGPIEYLLSIKRRKWSVLFCTVCGVGLGLLASLTEAPMYRARASLEVEGVNEDLLSTRQIDPEATGDTGSQAYFNTQIRILQSRPLLDKAAADLQADAEGSSERSKFNDLIQTVPPLFFHAKPPFALSGKALSQNLRVQVGADESRIVDISFDAYDPRLAADVANTIALEFINQGVESRWQSAQRTERWLNAKLADVKARLAEAEQQLQRYAQSSGLTLSSVSDNVDGNPVEQRLSQTEVELSRAQADRVMKQSVYESIINDQVKELPNSAETAQLLQYEAKLGDLRRELAELTSSLTPEHYRVKKVEAQIQELEGALRAQKAVAIHKVEQEYTTALNREKMLMELSRKQTADVHDQAATMVQYSTLKHEVDATRALYEAMLQKVKEYGIAAAIRVNNVRLIEPATPPGGPFKPRPVINLGLGLFGGALGGIVLAILRDKSNQTIQRPGEASFYVDLPELGVIPSARLQSYPVKWFKPKEPANFGLALKSPENVIEDNDSLNGPTKSSVFAESFRSTVASLLLQDRSGRSSRVLVISSLNPGDGKTSVTLNLAMALTEAKQRVLLIDADRQRPKLHKMLNLTNESGLSNALASADVRKTVAGLIRTTPVHNLFLITSGDSKVPSFLPYRQSLKDLAEHLRAEFDTILIDSPPLLAMADARILGSVADGILLVLRAGITSREALCSARQRLEIDGTPVIGVVLNDWNPKVNGYRTYGASRYEYTSV